MSKNEFIQGLEAALSGNVPGKPDLLSGLYPDRAGKRQNRAGYYG